MVASGIATSIVSAAVLEGNLILGLSNGSIIDCGTVQGPRGLTGDQGPMGATGKPGLDGNTIHTVEGAPSYDLGRDGDFAINTVAWEIYSKSSGQWGTGTPLRGNKRNGKGDTGLENVMGGPEGGDSGGGGRLYNTGNLPLAGTGRDGIPKTKAGRITAPGGNIIPEGNNLTYQSNLNAWVYSSLSALDDSLPVSVGDVLPDNGEYEGDLFLKDGLLYIYTKGEWISVGGESGPPVYVGEDEPPGTPQTGELWYCTDEEHLTLYIYDGAVWVPAAPPVSLEGIENSIASVDAELMKVNANIAMNKRDIDEAILDIREDQERQDEKITEVDEDQQRQDEKIAELEGEVDDLKPTIERGEWAYNAAPENANSPAPGEYHAYVVVSDDYCKQKLGECLLNAGGDLEAGSNCNRENEKCLEKVDTIDTDVPWHDVTWLVVHRNDIEGRQHSFGDVVPGLYIEVINADGTGHGLYMIEAKSLTGVKCGFNVKLVHSTGHPNGKAVIKIFKMAEAANPADFVKKDGDEMTGALKVTGYSEDDNPLLKVAPTSTKGSNSDIFKVYSADGNSKFWITNEGDVSVRSEWFPKYDRHLTTKKYVDTNFVNKAGATMTGRLNVEVGKSTALYLKSGLTNTSSIFYVRNATDKTQFRVTGTGQVQAGDSSDTAFMAAQGNDVVTKKYLDETLAAVGVSPYGVPYKYVDPSTRAQDLKPGEFFISNSSDPKHCIYASQYAMSDNQNPLISDRYAARGVNICLKVYDSNGTMKHQVQCSDIGTGNGSNNYVKWTKSYNFTEPDDLKVGEIYYLSDGFLLPY